MVPQYDVARSDLLAAIASGLRRARPTRHDIDGFVQRYLDDVALEDVIDRGPEYFVVAIARHLDLATERTVGTPAVAALAVEGDGSETSIGTRTVIQVVTDDMPFLVDSVSMAVDRHDHSVALILHPIIDIETRTGARLGDNATRAESYIHIELEVVSDFERDELCRDITDALIDVSNATSDWQAMRAQSNDAATVLSHHAGRVSPDEVAEAHAFLVWLADNHFTFLGYREYDLVTSEGHVSLVARDESGLGILRRRVESSDPISGALHPSDSFARLSPAAQADAQSPTLLVMTKANSRSTVHRDSYLDYVGIKQFDDLGNVVGERRFLGLYTSSAYHTSPSDIPLVREKVRRVIEQAGFAPQSHSGKDLVDILETYPRDELFQMRPEDLLTTSIGILQVQERRRVRLFVRRDTYGRFVTCLLYVPRDRYNTSLRLAVTDLLVRAFRATGHEYQARVSESRLARLYFVLHVDPGAPTDVDDRELEQAIAAASRSWSEELRERLVTTHGTSRGYELWSRYGAAFPAQYHDAFGPPSAVADIEQLELLATRDGLLARLRGSLDGRAELTVMKSSSPLALSDVMPVLSNFGVRVLDEHPYELFPQGRAEVWIEQFGLDTGMAPDDLEHRRAVFEDAFVATVRGHAENDGFNALVLSAAMKWTDVVVLRAYCRYLRQVGTPFSQEYLARALASHPRIANQLVSLFHARFDPDRATIAADETARLTEEISEQLDAVQTLDEDRILRSLLTLILSTLRTNAFSPSGRSALAVKLDPRRVPDMPRPVPAFEIFVYAPRVEGVHLRMGRVARGGIRWSDRPEDFRTEVLGLVKAQSVKNAVIVPVGAKGGFIVKQPPAGADRDTMMREVVACYQVFIGSLLDVTDNLVEGEIASPGRTVRYDADDPYFVVAADKGTATFSDIANEIAVARHFWLGDAFASGGSAGYDHKAMGITAKGAWESVAHHFRQLGVDVQREPFTVVGVGDMSGDVFGNGMLLSPEIRLVAAFDHRHIFLDPEPDAAAAFAERERLFALARSSWDDYDRTLLSGGGGIYPRSAKSIPLSEPVQRVLAIDAVELTPADLIAAILKAPVDLLWNGGIGTYVKSTFESNADVGDKANDGLRVDGADLRCRVVGEGGNLGLTQLGRIEFALRGGSVNTDAIDNSAGVDCSDHEVNIKVLLHDVARSRGMSTEDRNTLLASMTDEVAALVLRDNSVQNRALTNARAQSAGMVDVHRRYLNDLEQRGDLDRALEFLPDDDTLSRRAPLGIGLTGPEFAVVMAYTKNLLDEAILSSDLPDEPDLAGELLHYFPTPLQERFGPEIARHPLRREITATSLANSMVNYAGTTFMFRLAQETGAPAPEIVRAHYAAWHLFDQGSLWSTIEAVDRTVAASVQTGMYLESRKLVERASRWILTHRPRGFPIADTIAARRGDIHECMATLPGLLRGSEARWLEEQSARLIAAGVPDELAVRVACLDSAFGALDICDTAATAARPVAVVAEIYTRLGDALRLDWLRDRITEDLPRDDRWEALSRNALRDDAHEQHRRLAASVVASSRPDEPPTDAVTRWCALQQTTTDRLLTTIEEIRERNIYDFPTLSVALREVRAVAP